MYIKKINDFIKENNNNEQRIIFSDFISLFKDNYQDMLSWLNTYCKKKRVIYIDHNGHYIDEGFITDEYSPSRTSRFENNVRQFDGRVNVRMIGGKHGDAAGLVFKDEIILPNKKMKKIIKPEIDPYNEEDWGYEEI